MKIGTKITLSDALVKEGYALGKARHDSNRQAGNPILHCDGNMSIILADQEGVCGELAFAQLVDAPSDQWAAIREIRCRSAMQGTDDGDCRYKGFAWDVKTTKYAKGHVLITENKLLNPNVDGYVLITGKEGNYTFEGCISHARVLDGIRTGLFDKQSHRTYWVNAHYLSELPEEECTDEFHNMTLDAIERFKAPRPAPINIL